MDMGSHYIAQDGFIAKALLPMTPESLANLFLKIYRDINSIFSFSLENKSLKNLV